jgi:hypothetical protein
MLKKSKLKILKSLAEVPARAPFQSASETYRVGYFGERFAQPDVGV